AMSARYDRKGRKALTTEKSAWADSRQAAMSSNENKMSDGGRERVPLGMELSKSSQNLIAQRSAVRSIAWLGLFDMTWRKDDEWFVSALVSWPQPINEADLHRPIVARRLRRDSAE